jgi:hypothetical protein
MQFHVALRDDVLGSRHVKLPDILNNGKNGEHRKEMGKKGRKTFDCQQ